MRRNHWRAFAALALPVLLAGCVAPPVAVPTEAGCAALAGRVIAGARIALPSGAATLTDVSWLAAAPPRSRADGGFEPAVPEHCQVVGEIAPVDPAAPKIRFQLNLPREWNGKTLQYGGGGFNGVLITGMAPLRDAPPGTPLPIARGFATFGTDSGHQAAAHAPSEVGAWALNEEALVNFAYASYKKVKDVAHIVATDFYGRAPRRSYFFGGSEGGREGLTMAQRFPADYDGIVSVVPVIQLTGLHHSFVRVQQLQAAGAWIPPAKVKAIGAGVARVCDALDGLVDGVVNNYLECARRFNPATLRCPDGRDAGDHCLSDAQVGVVRFMYLPVRFPFRLVNGLDAYPARLPGAEDHGDGWAPWVAGREAPGHPARTEHARQWLYGSNAIRYFIMRDAAFDVRNYDLRDLAKYEARIRRVSALLDSTDPDLSGFFSRGGRLVIRENAGDLAQSAAVGFEYFNVLNARFGREVVDRHVRLYVSPASTHSGAARSVTDGSEVPTAFDMLDLVDRWADRNEMPPDSVEQVLKERQPPHRVQASRPMCRYPDYPHFVRGDPKSAASYQCRHSGE